jgi:cysteinyl-tRNA synthetase
MSNEYLGESFDIHGGGKDLCFPHHENEIAQSEGVFGKQFVKYWIHNGFVNINQEKMSKSLGNFLMIKDVIKEYHPEVVRLFLLSNHYRSPIDFTDLAMDEARAGLDKIYTLLERLEQRIGLKPTEDLEPGNCWKHFCEAMDDDFNTARGIGILFDTVRNANRELDEYKESLPLESEKELQADHADILRIGRILGILTESPKTYFDKKRTDALKQQSLDPAGIDKMVQERTEARKSKEWEKADNIRNKLLEMNIIIEDRTDGTIWKVG